MRTFHDFNCGCLHGYSCTCKPKEAGGTKEAAPAEPLCKHCGLAADGHWSGQRLCPGSKGETAFNPGAQAGSTGAAIKACGDLLATIKAATPPDTESNRRFLRQAEGFDALMATPKATGEGLGLEGYQYARTLAVFLARKHWPEITGWKPLDTLDGVLSQIDNMITGMVRAPALGVTLGNPQDPNPLPPVLQGAGDLRCMTCNTPGLNLGDFMARGSHAGHDIGAPADHPIRAALGSQDQGAREFWIALYPGCMPDSAVFDKKPDLAWIMPERLKELIRVREVGPADRDGA